MSEVDHISSWIFWFGCARGGLNNADVLEHLQVCGASKASIDRVREAMDELSQVFYRELPP